MEYTQDQKRQFKREFAQIRWKKNVVGIPAVIVSFLISVASKSAGPILGIPPKRISGVVSLAASAGLFLFSSLIWRGPACDSPFGKAVNPTICPRCGVDLR